MTPQAFDPPKSSILELTETGQEYRGKGWSGTGAEGGEQTEKMVSAGLDILSEEKVRHPNAITR